MLQKVSKAFVAQLLGLSVIFVHAVDGRAGEENASFRPDIPDPIRIGILSHQPLDEAVGYWQPLQAALEKALPDMRFELHERGLPLPAAARTLFTDMPHDRVVEAVLDGRVDAGFVRTGIIEQRAAGGRLAPADIRVLNPRDLPGFPLALSTGLYPQWSLAAMPGLTVDHANRITAALLTLTLPAEDATAAAGLRFTIAVDYRAVEDLARALRLPPFDQVPPATLRQFVVSHPWFSAGFAILVLGLVFLSALLWQAMTRLRQTSARFEAVFQQSPAAILIHDPDTGEILDANPRAWRDYGLASRDELLERQASTWLEEAPYTQKEAIRRLQRAAAGEVLQFDWPLQKANGTRFWFRVTLAPIRLRAQPSVLALCIDITEQRLLDQRLKDSELRFRSLLDDIEGVAVQGYGLDGTVHYWNRGSELLYGYTREEALKSNLLDLIVPEAMRSAVSNNLARVAEGGSIANGELELIDKDGQPVLAYSSHTVVRSPGKEPELFCLDIDLSERKRHEQALLQAEHYDGLTGLPNRILLTELMRHAFAQADRRGTVLALCYLDLDRFKPINDRYGMAVGDQVLVRVARRLRRLVRGSDLVARLGGDEFVLVLEGLRAQPALQERLQFLLEGVSRPIHIDDHVVQVDTSIGVTLYPQDANDPDVLLRHANAAMLEAKKKGRNRYSLFDTQLEQDMETRRAKVTEIEQGIVTEQFVLHYQPKVEMSTGKLVGLEGLARWQHPDSGLLPPPAFLDYLDGVELECQFGEYVLGQALAQLEHWNRAGRNWSVSVNIAGSHLLSPGFSERLGELLAQYPSVRPAQLELEILESATLKDIDEAVGVLNRCDEMGIRVALDDFGTGYSSLSRLRSLPVAILKIDQSFVRNMLTDLSDYSIVKSVIGLAKAFDLEVIAEGVETIDHAVALLHLGCDQGQGYGFAKPMPADAVPEWFEQWQQAAPWRQIEARRATAAKTALAVVLGTHKAWLSRVLKGENGNSRGQSGQEDGDHHRCPLGRWLGDEGSRLFGGQAVFPEIVEQHRGIHQLSSRLQQARSTEDPAASELEQTLIEASARLTGLISRLQQ